MRTTIELPDELFRQAKARAALSGISLKELITRWVAQGLQSRDELLPATRPVPPLPQIIPPSGRTMPALTNAEIGALLDTEDAGVGHVGSG